MSTAPAPAFRPAGSPLRWLLACACAAALAACSSAVVRTTTAPTRSPAPLVSKPRPGATAVVQRGDTLYAISVRHGVSVQELAAWNGLAAPYTIFPGQRLRLSPAGVAPARPPRSTAPRPVAGTASRPPVRPPATSTPAPTPAPAGAPASSGFPWRWPADGALISRYVPGEPTRQGIGIAGASGAPVRAAADGTIVYSGAGLVGYGELVIIKHSENWLSAYGHNRRRLVNEGQLVKAGEQIAEMGRSGAPRDMLHFEIRYNGRPVDPLRYLPAR